MKINGKLVDICIHGFRIRKHMRYALALWLLGAGGYASAQSPCAGGTTSPMSVSGSYGGQTCTWQVPSGVTAVTISVMGAGGGGGAGFDRTLRSSSSSSGSSGNNGSASSISLGVTVSATTLAEAAGGGYGKGGYCQNEGGRTTCKTGNSGRNGGGGGSDFYAGLTLTSGGGGSGGSGSTGTYANGGNGGNGDLVAGQVFPNPGDVWALFPGLGGYGGWNYLGARAGQGGDGTITLTWAPGVTAAPTIVNFGNAWVGLGNHHDVTVTNNSATAVTIGPITFTDVTGNPADFIAHNYCTKPLKPGRSCEVNAKFAPSSTETETATMNIDVDGSPLQVSLTGTGKVPTKRP
ncbi:MAG: choice-of-anchor D domain-containing protein [Terriglobales bacterium]|jgi:hypothetical protein